MSALAFIIAGLLAGSAVWLTIRPDRWGEPRQIGEWPDGPHCARCRRFIPGSRCDWCGR